MGTGFRYFRFVGSVVLALSMGIQWTGAQLDDSRQQGVNLGNPVDALADVTRDLTHSGLPCRDIWDRAPDMSGLTCLLERIGREFQIAEQWDLMYQIFDSRYANRLSWSAISGVLKTQAQTLNPLRSGENIVGVGHDAAEMDALPQSPSFAGLIKTMDCPFMAHFQPVLPNDLQIEWVATPEGFRDLSPPRVRQKTEDHVLLLGALRHPDPLAVLRQTPCTAIRVPLTRALFRSALAFGNLDLAQGLASLNFMPYRYGRQALGAAGDSSAMDKAVLEVADAVLGVQLGLEDPSIIQKEVSTLLNEIDRQFAIDFLLGKLWVLDLREILSLEADFEFVDQVASLLSRDAWLLQQRYEADEVRFFYRDFFDILVAKQAFALLEGLDLLIPDVIRRDFDLAIAAKPLTAASPTRFEYDQESLALLIRLREIDAILGVWADLSSAQQQDSVLFALDQGAWSLARRLYFGLSSDQVSVDFLIRLSLYYADAIGSAGNQESSFELGQTLKNGL